MSRRCGPGVFGPRGDFFSLTTGYGEPMPDASADISPLVTRARPPRAVGDVVLAAERCGTGSGPMLTSAAASAPWLSRLP